MLLRDAPVVLVVDVVVAARHRKDPLNHDVSKFNDEEAETRTSSS